MPSSDTTTPPPPIPTLNSARKAQRLTQAELAERAGLSRMTVQRLESGSLDPRLSTLQEMARVLGMDLVAVPTALRPQLEALLHPPVAEPPSDDPVI